jgi:hypothetical protein
MYMFQTQGLNFRKTVVISAGMVKCVSTCIVHPGTSECGYAEITIRGIIGYLNKIFEL